jgi:hypothetical protein
MSLLKDSKPQNGFPYYAFGLHWSVLQNFLRPYLLLFPDKLERLPLPLTHPSMIFAGKAGAYQSEPPCGTPPS